MIRYSYMIIDQLASFGGDDDIRRTLEFIKDCGYEGVELNLREPPGIDLDRLQQWLGEIGLIVPSFLTGEAYKEGLCLCSPDPARRRGAVQRLIHYLDTAQQFDAILVVGLLQGLQSDEGDIGVANERIADCLRQVCTVAAARNLELVVEPVNHLQVGFHNSVAEVRRLVEVVDSPALKPMVDTIHMNVEDPSLTQPILDCGTNLRHVHLCESNGALFGSGHIDFRTVLKTLNSIGYDGFASAKIYRKATIREAAPSSIQYLRSLKLED